MGDSIFLRDVAEIIRSKNAGPFRITFDIIFSDDLTYMKFKTKNYFDVETVIQMYQLPGKSSVIDLLYFDNARALKVTIKREMASGSVGDTDIYGTQQHIPFLSFELKNW